MKLLYFFVRRWSSSSSDRRDLHARLTMMQPKYEARGWKSKCVSGAHTVHTTALLSAVRLTTQYGFTVYSSVCGNMYRYAKVVCNYAYHFSEANQIYM